MPYETRKGTWQRARRLGHVPIIENQLVKERLGKYRVHSKESGEEVTENLMVFAESLPDPKIETEWVLSFDGSSHEVAIDEKYPSTRVGYIQVAGVLVYLREMLSQSEELFVDPALIRRAAQESLISVVLPSCNICRRNEDTVRDSWRIELYETFQECKVEGTSLLDFCGKLLDFGERTREAEDKVLLKRCSGKSCSEQAILVPKDGTTNCPGCGTVLFPTDTLRLHEEVKELNTNLTPLGRLMSLLEHLVMLSYLDYLLERQPRVLSSVAFVIDGPLALFGPQAPLKRAILSYLQFATRKLRQAGYGPPVVVGIEKSGQFAEHAAQIAEYLPRRTLMRIPHDYIFQRILTTRAFSDTPFGEDTYYGRKFFYKSSQDQMLTITIPCLDETLLQSNDRDDPICYTTLPETLALLDRVGTKLYKDALIPVALAHSFASIPLKTGSRVLTLLAQDLVEQND